ncbi:MULTISPECIES: hypothetical protein [unclassified Moraxella]|uniref:hypothetical protein n=1 Tax=unclassified Moraxella TaxID=2685852 RepID=UPI003AF62229
MKMLKLAVIPAALIASSAFAAEVVQPVAYNPETGVVQNTTNQVLTGTKTVFETVTHPGAVSAEVGTLGYGANVAWGVNDKTELVAGWTGGKIDGDVDINSSDSYINWNKVLGDEYQDFDGNINYKLDLNNPYLGVNLRPFANGLTVGTGVIFQDNEFKALLNNDGGSTDFTIDGTKYSVSQGSTVGVAVAPRNDLAPYLTLGYRPNINARWGLFGEVGAAYMGKSAADVNVNAATVTSVDANGSVTNINPNDLPAVANAKQQLKDDLMDKLANKQVIYPIAKVGVTYRF